MSNRSRIIELLVQHARPIILEYFRPDSCIASTRIGLNVLSVFGIPAFEQVMRFSGYTAPLFERLNKLADWSKWDGKFLPGEHSVGIGYGPPKGMLTKAFDGHLVIVAPWRQETDPRGHLRHTLIDLSLDNASRPAKGLPLAPFATEVPDYWDIQPFVISDGTVHMAYQVHPEPPDYFKAKDWWVRSRWIEPAKRIITKIKEEL